MNVKIKQMWGTVKSNWKTPPKGKYVSYKEVLAYSVGGMGVNFIAAVMGQIVMAASCLLIGSVYQIKPTDLALIMVISSVISLVVTPLRASLIDNTKSKKGKFRPLILWTGIPTAIIATAMAFIPLNADYIVKVVLIGVGFNILNIIYNQFFYVGYTTLVQVMTPNSSERAGIISFSSIVYSLAPTITSVLFPLFAEMLGTDLVDIAVYRLAFPIFCIIGLLLSFFAYFGTKERIVVPKRYVAKVNFWHGMKSVCSNKYFWIANISGWFAFAKSAAAMMLTWVFVYHLQNNVVMSALTLITGTASLIGMATAPLLIKWIGKKNLIIASNLVYGLAFGAIFFFPSSTVMVFILNYIANIANATTIITLPAVNADVLDYQQWKTGERLEGFAANIGIIGAVIGMGTALIIPYVTECYGLIENYDILYDVSMRVPFFRMLAVISLIGGALTLLPFLFYNLTEKRHSEIINDLKERALDQNKEDGINETLEELDQELAENQELNELLDKINKKAKAHKHTDEENVEETEIKSEESSKEIDNEISSNDDKDENDGGAL